MYLFFKVENMLIWKPNAISCLFVQECVKQPLCCNLFIYRVQGSESYVCFQNIKLDSDPVSATSELGKLHSLCEHQFSSL